MAVHLPSGSRWSEFGGDVRDWRRRGIGIPEDPATLGRAGRARSFRRLTAPIALLAPVVTFACSCRAGGSPIDARSALGRALRSAVPDGRATPPAPFSYTAGFHQPISHTASAGGTGYLTIFQEISSGPLSVSVDGAGPVILTDGEINYGLISPGAHTITATSGPETVASGSVVVPAGQRLTAVIHLAPGGVPTVTGFDNDRSVPPLANLSWSFVTPPMRHRLTSTSAGRWWLQTWPTIPPRTGAPVQSRSRWPKPSLRRVRCWQCSTECSLPVT